VKKLISKARALDREEGFSLAELLIAFAILALLVYAAFNLLDVNINAGSVYTMRVDISQELRESTEIMVDQLRTARSFSNAQSDNVVFTSYLTGTNDLYNVQFFLEGDTIVHRMNTGVLTEADNIVVASNVTGLELYYYDSATNLLADPNSTLSSISLVEIKITMTLTSGGNVMTESMETMVRIRR
jgi:type II secretory pathway pseudopilin PulG